MSIDNLDKIKRLAVISMFSDDDLMEMFVLKGGNAIDMVHKIALRASKDIDFSIENEFKREDYEKIQHKIENALGKTFREEGYEVFDVNLSEKPLKISEDVKMFWGGYQIDFKIIEREKYAKLHADINALRRNAVVVRERNKRKFRIDVSKFEFCQCKQESDLDGYTIFVYTLEMIVIEKLRAICQQMPEYAKIVKSHSQSARARDFFDIYTVLKNFNIDLTSKENTELIRNIFDAKRVPLKLLGETGNYREYHRPDFVSVENTVKADVHLESFDFYFDYVVKLCENLESLWKI